MPHRPAARCDFRPLLRLFIAALVLSAGVVANAALFDDLLNLPQPSRSLGRMDVRALFCAYWRSVETASDAVDRLLHASH